MMTYKPADQIKIDKIRILVVEDDVLQLDYLESLLESHYEIDAFASLDISFEYLVSNPPDLALLDIHLGEENPLAGAKFGKILKEKFHIPIIFVTAYPENYDAAEIAEPEAYLTKAYKDQDVLRNIDLAIKRYYGFNQKLSNVWFFRKNLFLREDIETMYVKVSYSNLLYVEAENINTYVHTKDSFKSCYHIKGVSLKNFNEYLPKVDFCKIHRGFVVNLDHVTGFNRNLVFLGSIELPLGDAYREEFERKMKRRM